MSQTDEQGFNIGHPAPDRGRLGWIRVTFGLLGAPLAWSLQLSANSAIAGLACLGPAGALTEREVDGGMAWLVAINLAALVVAVLALLVAWSNIRATQHEEEERSGGIMQAGEGRTRFLAVWGIWIGLLFLTATAANSISMFWGDLCLM